MVAADREHLDEAASQLPDTPRLWALLCSETGIIANPSSLRMKRGAGSFSEGGPSLAGGP